MAREAVQENHNLIVGQPEEVWQQVVSGFNYKFVFEHDIQVTIYVQPWTNTYKLLKI
jgi:hypothetical protein